jgi:hypothetical protein
MRTIKWDEFPEVRQPGFRTNYDSSVAPVQHDHFLLNVNNGKTAIRKKARPAPTLKTKGHEPVWPLPKMAVAGIRAQV